MYNFFSHHTLVQGSYKLQQIQIDQQIGRGNSHVYTAYINKQQYAIKQIQIKDEVQQQNFLQQISFMYDLSMNSQKIVKYFGYFITKMQIDQYLKHKYAFIIMQCAQMNLQHLVLQYKQTNQRFSQQNLQKFIETILNVLLELQNKHIAHCDIKPENVLIMNTKSYDMKLCDVGSSKIVTGDNFQQATILGTVPFLAPQLIKIKSKKIVSTNPFKSDVFSFGLVFLYLITFKKFKSQDRIEVQQSTYKQIINQWIKQAKQLLNFDYSVCLLLTLALEFNQNKRPMFKQLKQAYMTEKNKKYEQRLKKIQQLQKQQQDKYQKIDYNSTYYQSLPGNQINLFKSRKLQKSSIKAPTTNTNHGSSFRITKTSNIFKQKSNSRNFSPISPISKKRSIISSPENKTPNISSTLFQIKKLIYINNSTKDYINEINQNQQQEKTFVLEIPYVCFKKADTVVVFPKCGLEVVYMLENVRINKVYIEYEKVEGIGLADDAPKINSSKIRANFIQSQLLGGYTGTFQTFLNPLLQVLQLRISQSQVTYDQVIQLIDSLFVNCPKLNSFLLCWQKNILAADQHFVLTQKLAKLPLKKLYLIMNENYIKYDKQMTWLLPKTIQSLYLQYGHNLLNSIINNLSLSISSSIYLKQLYLNFENNNLLKGQINMISKSILQLKNLQKLILDISLNKIDDLNYLQKNLSEHINLNVIEIRLHKTETSIERTIEFIKSLKELFQFKLKILKVTINRHINVKMLKEMIDGFCVEKGVKKIISDVIGFDNSYFMVYLKKKPKVFNRNNKNSTSIRKDKLQNALKFSNTISLAGTTLSSFNPLSIKNSLDINNSSSIIKPSLGLCTRLFTMSSSYQNYICLGCCQLKQSSKSTYYCKFCIQHCFHKGHNIVKVYSKTVCSCSHSGHCMSDVSQNLCAEKLQIYYKKKYQCIKCEKYLCIGCLNVCNEMHKGFVIQYKEMAVFKCGKKQGNNDIGEDKQIGKETEDTSL